MGVRIEVRKGETIEQALKRFRELVRRHGSPGALRPEKWHKKQFYYYMKPSELRRQDQLGDEWTKHVGECARRHLVSIIRRGCKRRKAHFGDCPIVDIYPR